MCQTTEKFDEMTGPIGHNCWDHADARATNETTHGQEAPATKPRAKDGAYSSHERNVRAVALLDYQSRIVDCQAFRDVPHQYRGDLLDAIVEIQRELADNK